MNDDPLMTLMTRIKDFKKYNPRNLRHLRIRRKMKMQSKRLDPRCREIHERLTDFMNERLGVIETGEVQGHLLTCDDCNLVYWDLIEREVASQPALLRPLPESVEVPPMEWYDAYLRERSGWGGVLWDALRKSLEDADAAVRNWATEQTQKVGDALQNIVNPMLQPDVVRVRGAVRTRGGVKIEPIRAEVLSAVWEPTGETVSFEVEDLPHVTLEGRFRVTLKTKATGYDGCAVLCSVALPEMMPISFKGTLQRGKAAIDEAGVPCAEGVIEMKEIKVAVVRG
jgi:hypothetical protein